MLSGFGKTLIAAGVVVLLFAAYQLWGTGLQERRSQGTLNEQFASTLAQVAATDLERLVAGTTSTSTAPSTEAPASTTTAPLPQEVLDLLYPPEGEPVAVLRIPKIGVEKVVVEGTSTEDLKRGPGRYEETPLPGQPGNAAIAGHRTTYGAPFFDIDQLVAGDEIRVTNVLGEAVYRVEGSIIVDPTEVGVVGDFGDNRITLTACHPKYSAAKRIVVWGLLVGEPQPTIPRPLRSADAVPVTTMLPTSTSVAPEASTPTTATDPLVGSSPTTATTAAPEATATTADGFETGATIAAASDVEIAGLAGDGGGWPGTIGWGAATAALAAAAWFVARTLDQRRGRRFLRRLAVYTLASPLVLAALYYCFVHVDRLLPAI